MKKIPAAHVDDVRLEKLLKPECKWKIIPLIRHRRSSLGVPKGEILKFTFEGSKNIPGHHAWKSASMCRSNSQVISPRVCLCKPRTAFNGKPPRLFDNLIAKKKEMPVTIGIFITPGKKVMAKDIKRPELDRFNRSFWVRWRQRQLRALPVGRKYFHLFEQQKDQQRPCDCFIKEWKTTAPSEAPAAGAVCALHCSMGKARKNFQKSSAPSATYTGLRGGRPIWYTRAQNTNPKPIRLFMQDGSNDLNILRGRLVGRRNESMEARPCVFRLWCENMFGAKVPTNGGARNSPSSPKRCGGLWRDYPKTHRGGPNKKSIFLTTSSSTTKGGSWWGEGVMGLPRALPSMQKVKYFFQDIPNAKTYKISTDGKTECIYRGFEKKAEWHLIYSHQWDADDNRGLVGSANQTSTSV